MCDRFGEAWSASAFCRPVRALRPVGGRDDDIAVYGDKGYASDAKKRAAAAAGVLWAVKEKAKPGRRLTARQRAFNHRFGKVRAKVEHVFRVVKCQFGKNGAQVFSLLALANLYLARRTLASA